MTRTSRNFINFLVLLIVIVQLVTRSEGKRFSFGSFGRRTSSGGRRTGSSSSSFGWGSGSRTHSTSHSIPQRHPSPVDLSYPKHTSSSNSAPSQPIGWHPPASTNTNSRPIGWNPPTHGSSSSGVNTNSNHQASAPPHSAVQSHATANNNKPSAPPQEHHATATNVKPVNNAYPQQPAQNPGYYPGSPHPPPYTPGNGPPPAYHPGNPPPYHPNPSYQQNYHQGHAPPPYQPGAPPSGYHPYPQQSYHPNSGYPGGYGGYHSPQGGAGGVTIINNNNHHSGSGYGGGYYHPSPVYPSYHYSSSDTGSGALGFFLGYSLGRISTPTYYHSSHTFYDGYSPRYDHYTVHHYYHNRDNVPKESSIQSNSIVACVGDSSKLCPSGTQALCTTEGAIMCVASATSLTPCSDGKQVNCVKTTIPCVNNTAPECQNNKQNETTVSIPCVSTAKVYGELSYVNNTIVIKNANVTSNNQSLANSTIPAQNQTVIVNGTVTETTTLPPTTTTTTTAAPAVKKEPEMFCVTVLALPAKRQPTEGEKTFSQASNLFSKFVVKAFGIS